MNTQLVNETIDQAFYPAARHALRNPSSNLDITLDYQDVPHADILTGQPEPTKTLNITTNRTTIAIPSEARCLAQDLISNSGRLCQIKTARINRTWINITGITDPLTLDNMLLLPVNELVTNSIAYNITANTKDTYFRAWVMHDIRHTLDERIIHPGDIHCAYPDIAHVNIDAPSQNARIDIVTSLRYWLDGIGLIDH